MSITKAEIILFLATAASIMFGFGDTPLFAREGYNEPPRQASYDKNGLVRINSDYFALSADTGGDFYFWAPGEFAAAAPVLRVPVTSDPIMLDYGTGGSFAKSSRFPVDSGIALLSVFVGAQRRDAVVLHRPDGRTVAENPAFVSAQEYRHMTIITVDKPEPGTWLLEFSGVGYYAVSVRHANGKGEYGSGRDDAVDLIDMKFVQPGGRPGHEGLFPVKARVRAGESRLCRIVMSGAISDPAAEFVSRDDRVLGQVELRPLSPGSGGDLLGTCSVPSVPFRTRVSGRDAHGNPFQRVTGGVYTPEISPVNVR
jgi:hypothetical protein